MNQICKTAIEVRRLTQCEAEVWVQVEAARLAPTTQLRGKLHGPRCPGVTTVEIAYPLLPARSAGGLTARVLIDEPNLWTETTPFVYEGTVELWEDGRCCDTAPLTIGLKMR